MIQGFADAETEGFFRRGVCPAKWRAVAKVAERKLDMLDAATSLHEGRVMVRLRSHPGEILGAEYLEPLGLSSRALAAHLGVPANRISDIVRKRRDVSADTAIRLGRYFDTDPRFWLNLQAAYDLSVAQRENDYSAVKAHDEVAA
jgi:addiction module HigA family antidote